MLTPQPHNKREQFAQAIAESFNDQEHLSRYQQACKKYPMAILYRAYSEAKSMPAEQVKKSRTAIFFYLIKRYAHERRHRAQQNTGD